MPPPYIRKLYFRWKKEIGESDKKRITLNCEAVIRTFPTDLREHPFVYKPCISDKFVAIFTLWSNPICCLSFQAWSAAGCAGINTEVSSEFTFSSSVPGLILGGRSLAAFNVLYFCGSEHSLNTKFLLSSPCSPAMGRRKQETQKKADNCAGDTGEELIPDSFTTTANLVFFQWLQQRKETEEHRNRVLSANDALKNPADPNQNPIKISRPHRVWCTGRGFHGKPIPEMVLKV